MAFAPQARAQQSEPVPVYIVTVGATSTVLEAPKPKKQPKYGEDTIEGNCWLYVKSIYSNLPNTPYIVNNTQPYIGAVAFFKYGAQNHYAIITELDAGGYWVDDTNFGGPGFRHHYYKFSNPHIRGYFNPNM